MSWPKPPRVVSHVEVRAYPENHSYDIIKPKSVRYAADLDAAFDFQLLEWLGDCPSPHPSTRGILDIVIRIASFHLLQKQ